MKVFNSIVCFIAFIIIVSSKVDQSLLDIKEIKELDLLVSNSYLLKHDFLRCFQEGDFANMTEAAAILASNHFVYSKNFIKYLEKVVQKVDNIEISKPILENINEENGNYEDEDIKELASIGIEAEWYNNIPHKFLSQRFFDSLGLVSNSFNDINSNTPGAIFTRYMINLYDTTNVCESLGIIGFAIEETVSKIYEYIWEGLIYHTDLTDDQYVFFPLHILLDDGHADLLKLAYKHYLIHNNTLCQNTKNVIQNVLDERTKMYDAVREEIETKQQHKCKRPYSPFAQLEQILEENTENCDTDSMVQNAKEQTLKIIDNSYWTLTDKMTLSARILGEQGHGETLSGQITCKSDHDTIYVNSYGKPLEIVGTNDFIEIDNKLNVINGEGFANKATNFHFHVYSKREDIKCIIHTHPPYTSALSLTGYPLHINHMDTMIFYNDVQYLPTWPGIPFGDEEGDIISNILSDKYYSALLAHHGLIVGGKSIEEATYRAYFFERAAKMQLSALAAVGGDINKLPKVNQDLAEKAREWRKSKGPVNAHFNGWAKILLKKDNIFIKKSNLNNFNPN